MIVAERKPLTEIKGMLQGKQRVLVVGCNTCVTICMAGGRKEVAVLASALRLAGLEHVGEETVERQCDMEFLAPLTKLQGYDCLLSTACGIGVQLLGDLFPGLPVYPALNTKFLGVNEDLGCWSERCQSCGDCILDRTGGICPIARCSKSLLNGPCGGSQNGKCEVNGDVDCAWRLIYDRLEARGELDKLETIFLPKDWSHSRDGGPRRIRREDVAL